jgi:hypothetical protein
MAPAPTFAARPSSSFGYWRGGMSDGPLWLGQGSGYGPMSQGAGQLPPGSGANPGKGWSPTVIYLLVFVVAEMAVFKVLERTLR